MKGTVRYMISGLAAAVFLALCALMLSAESAHRAISTCSRVEVSFTDSLRFVSEDDVKNFLHENYGPCIGRNVDSVALGRIESLLESRSSVVDAQAWLTPVDGVLHIQVAQRAPVLRFEGHDGSSFYTDAEGFVFPLHKSYTADVPVVNGVLPVSIRKGYSGPLADPRDRKFLLGLIEIERTIRNDRKLSSEVEGISISEKGDITIKLKRGKEKFIFGDASDIKEKFDKINRYFGYIVPAVGEGYYESVNLKYKNQIICRQKDI